MATGVGEQMVSIPLIAVATPVTVDQVLRQYITNNAKAKLAKAAKAAKVAAAATKKRQPVLRQRLRQRLLRQRLRQRLLQRLPQRLPQGLRQRLRQLKVWIRPQ
jgi:hypothetical protein